MGQILRVKSVFTQNFIGLLLILSVLSMVCCTVISGFVISETTENLNRMRVNELEQVITEVDGMLSYVEKSLVKFTRLEDVVRGTVLPSRDALERNSSILTALRNETAMNQGIESLSLYAAVDNKIFSSEGGFQELEQYENHGVIEEHIAGRKVEFVLGTSYWITMQMMGEQLYMFCDFFYSLNQPIGTLTAKINMELIREALQSVKEEGTYIYILAEQGRRIGFQDHAYVENENNMEQITRCSGYNGWNYYYSYQTEPFLKLLSSLLHVVFPILLVFLLLSLGMSFYGARISANPVRRLLKGMGYDAKSTQNEYELLDSYYRSTKQEQLRMKSLIEEYSPKIMESLFHGILDGRVYSSEEIAHVIQCTDNRWEQYGAYEVLVFAMNQENGQPLTALQEEVLLSKWKQSLGELLGKGSGNLCIFMFQKRYVLILCFPAREEESRRRSALKKVMYRVGEDAQYHRLALLTSSHHTCDYMKDIRYAYQEAVRDLEHESYYRASKEEIRSAEEPLGMEEASEKKAGTWLEKRLLQLQAEIEADSPETSRDLGYRIIEDVAKEGDARAVQEACQYLAEKFVRLLLLYNCNPEGDCMEGKRPLGDLAQKKSRQELTDYMKDYLDLVLKELEKQKSKRFHRAVLKTKEIIEESYSDSNLSLVAIAEKVRINPSYLSTLFIQSQHISLTDYLNEYRIQKAKQLLDITNISAKEVGYQVGFHTAQNFNRVFKRYTGVTPGQYKRR
ncbi:MAG: helix-turn-helix transcriptional regulator [Lachnospiraceae bacterium]|nr:helix-turn-helix transcriptional regulator [Lachnospiraceae bacterium]MCI8996181.1 helix-turn-helix transcriptional regulator [Lachnospiraceae bacterium]MCI9134590.1 helix-turn-helix transcriptional regulator [Lachnospiraceae bacterium]